MKNDFLKQTGCRDRAELDERLHKPWTKFINSKVLVRSIYDKAYPDENTLLIDDFTGYYKAEVYDFYHNGLMVRAYPYAKDIKYKLQEYDSEEFKIVDMRVEIFGCIPFENIIEYDIDGDEYYNYPHLFCDFVNVSDPYEKIVYRSEYGWWVENEKIIYE